MDTNIDAILKLPVDERLEIMEKIWDSLEINEGSNIPEWHVVILQERLNKHRNSLTEGKNWDEVKRRLLQL